MRLSEPAFDAVVEMFHRVSGIRLAPSKRQLVVGRLQKLASDKGYASLDDYVAGVVRGGADREELVKVVDRLTTNETYFFREPQHFTFLEEWLGARRPSRDIRIWSAASSSGEEAYSIAMLLTDRVGPAGWEVVGTDLSTAMVDAARRALYPMDRARQMPEGYLRRFCMKGQGPYEGQLLVNRAVRERVRFLSANLMQPLPEIGQFDIVFLRNVLIYFDPPAKKDIVQRILPLIKPGGYLFTGHSESLSNLQLGLTTVRPAIYARA